MRRPYGVKILITGFGVAILAGAAQGSCLGDLDNSGLVDGADIATMLGSWGPADDNPADINQDGWVDGTDLAILLGDWGCTSGRRLKPGWITP